MKTIWKYELETTDTQEHLIPENAQMLTVQIQNGVPCLWALVDTEEKKRPHVIETFGTGNPIPTGNDEVNRRYIGTYQLKGGALVFHVFARYWNYEN